MRTRFQAVLADERNEAVAKLISDHRLLAIPVVDPTGVMQGIVTVDDAMQMTRDSASREMQQIGGVEALEHPYLDTNIGGMIRKRAGWLSLLFLGEMFTATAMGFFQQEISRAVVLALFIPLIISSGGNSGSQAATLVIRAMAVGEVSLGHWWRVLRREILTGVALGTVLCTIGVTRILVWQGAFGTYGESFGRIALTVGASLIGVVLFGTIAGGMLPMILRACRLDPASASAPAVATLVDVSGLIIYFSIAKVFLLGSLQ
jgi:magnesium transporter